jgi:serine/threonine-protein kinase 11
VLHVPDTDDSYLVLDYADAGSLSHLLEQGHQFSRASILSIIKQIVDAVEYLHDAGFVHQDIKPGNILVNSNGEAFLADFGIGHSFESASMVIGSPAFQAPEALNDGCLYGSSGSEEPEKEDVWALGVTLFQLLFGRLPYTGTNLYEIVHSITEKPLEIPGEADPDTKELLKSLLSIDPINRISIHDLKRHPLIATAKDRADGLPTVDPPVKRTGQIVKISATVCGREGCFGWNRQQRISDIEEPPQELPRTKCYAHCSSSDDSDDEYDSDSAEEIPNPLLSRSSSLLGCALLASARCRSDSAHQLRRLASTPTP